MIRHQQSKGLAIAWNATQLASRVLLAIFAPSLGPSQDPPFPEGKQAEGRAFFVACPLCVWWPAARASNPPFTLCPVGEDSTTLRTVQLNSFLRGFTVHSLIPGAGCQVLAGTGGVLFCHRLPPTVLSTTGSGTSVLPRIPQGFSKCNTVSQKQVFYIPRSPFLKVIFVRMFIYHQFQ